MHVTCEILTNLKKIPTTAHLKSFLDGMLNFNDNFSSSYVFFNVEIVTATQWRWYPVVFVGDYHQLLIYFTLEFLLKIILQNTVMFLSWSIFVCLLLFTIATKGTTKNV